MPVIRPLLLALAALATGARTQPPPPTAPPALALVEPDVRVPIFPNSTCPIMGKKVSTKLFIDTEYGRIYICCKGCDKKILRAPELAYKTAFPTVEKVDNTVCPVSGQPIDKDATTVSLQGIEFRVAKAAHAKAAIAEAQVVLNKVKDPTLVDVRNKTCPVSDDPVQPNTLAIIGRYLVRLCSPEHVEAVAKAPAATLAKAQQLANKESADAKADADAGKGLGADHSAGANKDASPERKRR